jgi:hypothetical protein
LAGVGEYSWNPPKLTPTVLFPLKVEGLVVLATCNIRGVFAAVLDTCGQLGWLVLVELEFTVVDVRSPTKKNASTFKKNQSKL